MASIAKSFTATGNGDSYFVKPNDKLSYTVSGTFVATWVLERTDNGGLSFELIASGTGAVTAVGLEVFGIRNYNYRFRCSAFTSGTMVTSIDDALAQFAPAQELKDSLGNVVLRCAEQAVQFVGTKGVMVSSGQLVRSIGWPPPTLTSGTSTTPSATTVYLSQVYVRHNCTMTGIAINNGATVGTNKYIVALFTFQGVLLANSALAGTLTAGADVFQPIDFTGTYDAHGPRVYWLGLYVDGTTDRFRTVPSVGSFAGLAGSQTGQTFGTITTVTIPTTFTADKGPVGYIY